METRPSVRFSPQLVFGLIVITVGILFTLDIFDILNARDYLRYWPVLLIIFGLTKLSASRSGGRLFGLMLTVGGTLLLLDRLYYIDFDWRDFWPLLLIAIGGSMLWNSMTRRGSPFARARAIDEPDAVVNHFALMGGVERVNNSQDFRGGDLTAMMGGIELDLRQASIKSGEAVLNIFAFWGGISIKVPQDWSMSVQATPIMGSVEDKTLPPKAESSKRLVIKGYTIMGGVEIKN